MMKRSTCLTALLALAGCQSPKLMAPEASVDAPLRSAKVVVYRDSAPGWGQGDMYFGEEGKAYLTMNEVGTKEITLVPGRHRFEVSSKGAATFTFDALLEPDRTTCIKVSTNGANFYGRFVMPLMRNLASEFTAEVAPCPTAS